MRTPDKLIRFPLCAGLSLVHAALYLALLFLAAVLVLPHFITADTVRDLLSKELEGRVPEARILLESSDVSILPYPRISLENLSLIVPGNTLIQIRRLEGCPDLMSLFTGSPQPKSFVLQRPKLIMGMPQKTLNWARPEEPRGLSTLLGALPEVEGVIKNGEVQLFGEKILQFQKIRVDLDIAQEVRLNLRAESNFSRKLNLALQSDGNRSRIQGSLRTKGLRLELLAPYLSPRASQWIGSSRIGLDADFSFAGADSYQANIHLNPSRLQLTSRHGAAQMHIQSGLASISGNGDETSIRLEDLDLSTPQSVLDGTMSLGAADGKLSLDLRASGMDISSLAATCKGLFPEEEFIKSFSIVREGILPWARITTSGKNKEALLADLSIQGRLEEGKIDLPKPQIELDRVGGTFYIMENALSLTDLSGKLGPSEITSGRAAMGLGDEVDPLCLYLESRLDLADTVRLLNRNLDIPQLQKQLERIESLQGEANASFSLTKKGEEVDWKTKLSRIDLRARHEVLPLPFSLSRGKLVYEDGTLRFDQLRGHMGNSFIGRLEGSLRFGTSNEIRLDGGETDLALRDLAAMLKDLPALAPWREILNTLEGKLDLEGFNLRGPLQSPKQWDFQATGSLPRLKLIPPFLSQPLEISADSLSSKGRDLSWSGLTLSTPQSRIHSQGKVAFGPEGMDTIQGSIQGVLRSSELLDRLYALLPVPEPLRLKTPLSVSEGRFQWQGMQEFSLRTDFRLAGGTAGHVDLSADSTRYRLRCLRLHQGDKSATLQATLQGRSLDIVFDGELAMGELRSALRHPGPLHGKLGGDFRVSLGISPFQFVESHGVMRVNELDLPPEIGRPLLRLDRAHLEGRGKKISLHTFRLQLNNRPLDINGTVEITPESNILDLKLRAGDLDRKWLKTVQALASDSSSGESENPFRIKGIIDFEIDAFHLGELNIAPIHGIVDMRQEKTTVLIKEMGLCHLDPLGQVMFQGRDISAEASANIREKDLAQTISCLGGANELVTGDYSLSLRSRTEGEDLSELKSNNQGAFRFQARNGRIYRINILAKIIALLNTTEILFGNVPDLQKEGFGYHTIDAEGDIQGQIVHLKKVVVNGKSMKITANGGIDLSSQRMKLIVLVSPLKTVDRIISWIPLVNYILNDTLVTIPFRVTGKVGDPLVVPLSPQAVGSEVFGIMKRTLSLPFKLFQPLVPKEVEEKERENSEQ